MGVGAHGIHMHVCVCAHVCTCVCTGAGAHGGHVHVCVGVYVCLHKCGCTWWACACGRQKMTLGIFSDCSLLCTEAGF